MRLSRTKRHWDKFARTDPFWAVLTDAGKKGNQWRVDEFFQTGVDSVDAEIKGVLLHCPALRFGTALDFGCGVGRLSQALARHFTRITGIDISAEMLALARQYNRHGERVDYVLNTRDDLSQLADGTFDFVYSIITLQHMEPVYARRYIAEFVRVAAPGGVILFQVPAVSERSVPQPRPFTLWPDTLLKRLVRDLRNKFGADPVMEMHALPRAEVEAILTGAGATLIKSYRYDAAGDRLHSWGYLACKR
ncbi:class I SAM-dependent methyltransferase [Opitutus sp. GAS368]|jgi:2-polyprenyl-3-methyl-5-hydroxy-6-metoxy-1,4-benzoquinol methylase|uniref:class I SAM-dependent methyltransferase n=1 Tax=Opitutus sp. GAS368 TaxID=1882749 RepID=UPI000879C450|nr:class I SAM-dependent methyltransferase [Opitutus sp. GAS368]SDS24573.1 Methyltransferase domain-containing protein [Opitutus sp. GAS368]